MTQNAALQEEIIPAGGIAEFIMSDAEIEALEKQEASEAFGNQGIANFDSVARRMASYGRYGDDTVAHVETGELVIPKALIQGNDKLKESIFDHLRDLGVEDPERYVVGSGENSINPDTGLPEFFFKRIARAVSRVGRSVGRALKKVGKVVKKAAPILLTIGLTPFVGPVYAGAISGGIGSLLNGGNLRDALKTAALGGVTGAIGAGISGGISGAKAGTGFLAGALDNIKGAVDPSMLTSGFSRLGGVLTGQEAFSANEFLPKFLQDEAAVTKPAVSVPDPAVSVTDAAAYGPSGAGQEAYGLVPTPDSPIEFGTSADLVQTSRVPPPVPFRKPPAPFDPVLQADQGFIGLDASNVEQPGFAGKFLKEKFKQDQLLKEIIPKGGIETRFPGGVQVASRDPRQAFELGAGTGQVLEDTDFLNRAVERFTENMPKLDVSSNLGGAGVTLPGETVSEAITKLEAAARPLTATQQLARFSPFAESNYVNVGDGRFLTGSDAAQYARLKAISDIGAGSAEVRSPKILSQLLSDKGAAATAAAKTAPGLVQKFAAPTALGLGAAYAGGFFDTPRPPSAEEKAAEYKRYLASVGYPEDYSTYFYNPDGTRTEEGKKYLVGGLQAPSVASVVADQGFMGGFDAGAMAPTRTFEEGGGIFPRRTGGIGPNEGIPNEDSVRAMLMPGEFVMTTDAVRGADPTGQGNLNNGISTMYDMMSKLEMRGRGVA